MNYSSRFIQRDILNEGTKPSCSELAHNRFAFVQIQELFSKDRQESLYPDSVMFKVKRVYILYLHQQQKRRTSFRRQLEKLDPHL